MVNLQRSTVRMAGFALVAATAFSGAGCSGSNGPERATITGSVKYKGEPVPDGRVRFFGTDARLSIATLKSDGTFIVTDIPYGEVRVAIEEDPSAAMRQRMASSDPAKDATDKSPAAPKRMSIPSKYQDAKTSGLVYNISPATSQLDIELK